MMDKQLIEKFNQFKKDTEYSDLDLAEVLFEKIDIFNHPKVILAGSKKLENHNELAKINDKNGLPVYDASSNILTYVEKSKYPNCVFKNSNPSNPDLSFANEGNSSAGTNFLFHKGEYFINNHRTTIDFSKSHFYSKYVFLELKDMKQKYGFKRGYIPSQTELSRLKIIIPIPKNLDEKYTSLKIQQVLVDFIKYHQNRELKHMELLDSIMNTLGEMERLVLPLFFQKHKSATERFNKYCKKRKKKLTLEDIEFSLKRVDEIFDTVRRGASPRPIKKFIVPENYEGEKYGWLKIGDVTSSGMYLNKTKEYINAEGRKRSVLGKKGDFLITNSMTVGIPIILNIETCFHDGFLYLGFDNEEQQNYSELYFYHFFISFRDKLKGMSKTGIVSNLNTDIIKEVEIPIPSNKGDITSLEIQKIISEFFDDFYKSTNQLRELGEELKKLIQAYTQTLIHKIFNEFT